MSRPRSRVPRYVDVVVVLWNDASANESQGTVDEFGLGLPVISAGLLAKPQRSEASKYAVFSSDAFPTIGQIRGLHSIPREIVLKYKKVRVKL